MTLGKTSFEKLALTVLLIGGFGTFVAMFLGTADVIGTQVFGKPLPGALEITESSIVLIVFGGLGYAQIRGSHIRVELVYTHLGPRSKAAMDSFSHLMGLVFFSLLAWQGVNELLFSWRIGEATFGIVRIPVWPTRAILVLGTALLLVQLLIDLATSLRALFLSAPTADQYEP